MPPFRIATWNVDGYRASRDVAARQVVYLDSLAADALVLTEVRDSLQFTSMLRWFSAEGKPPYKPSDRAVGIFSRWPGQMLEVADSRLSVCVALEVPSPVGRTLVYGTIIPYAQDGVRSKQAQAWVRHREGVRNVASDCLRLRKAHPDAHLVLAGDFNMNLDGTKWYGDAEAREALLAGLDAAGLVCHSLADLRADLSADRANIDHICSDQGLGPISPMHVWCARKDEPGRLSDHNGVALALAPTSD